MLEDEDFLKAFHHALLEVHREEGNLVCPETGAASGRVVRPAGGCRAMHALCSH